MAVPPLIADGGFILVGIVLLTGGAWLVVESGSAMAKRWGMSPLWIGLTVVAFGTSLPELMVTVSAAYQGFSELAAANIVGSNIMNVLIVMGATAAIVVVPVKKGIVRRELPMVAAASILVWVMALNGVISRWEGFVLVGLVPVYIWFIYKQEKQGIIEPLAAPDHFDNLPMRLQWLSLLGGIGGLMGGGAALVEGARGFAEAAGMADRVIGLTVVAVGTSLPELATSLMAAFRRKIDMAVGNLVGSNILNLLFVLGAAAAVRAQSVPETLIWFDLPVMIGASFLLLRFAWTNLRVTRWEGIFMLVVYVGYIGFVLAG
jgi:cation:H+ antiporter